MDVELYIKKTRELAVYPDEYERDYVIHGLVDETGEVVTTLRTPPTENGVTSRPYSAAHVDAIEQELGDVMWYIARLIDHFEFDGLVTLLEDDRSVKKAMDPDVGERLVDEALLAATRINGHQKKSVRDEGDRTSNIRNEAAVIIQTLKKAAHHLGVRDLNVVMRRNLEKLFDRKARDVLHGDGDNR